MKGLQNSIKTETSEAKDGQSLPNLQTDSVAISLFKSDDGDFFTVQIPFNKTTMQLGKPIIENTETRFRDEAIIKFKMLAIDHNLV